uniref:Uncharacterized protein n=1 Tax=uncultured bacterium Lac161 TaxID=1403002 RepID=A0A059QCS9_9BACT|nr:hypothetical protein [uncultured bacterium Lac161]
MFIRWSKWLVVLALVIVTGGHWSLLQSAAWVGMAVNYSKCEPIAVALQKTFDGQNPCQLCHFVKEGKAAEQKRDLQKLEAKFEFLTVAGTCGLFPPRPFRHFTPQTEGADARVETPPLPPPRAA